jgi:hypothetical protein
MQILATALTITIKLEQEGGAEHGTLLSRG